MDRVIVLKEWNGLIAMSVCAVEDATDEEILEVCNKENPSGTDNRWCNVVRNNEEPDRNPKQCESYPDRLHYLVYC